MYKTILVTLDGTSTDRAIIEHVKPLAKLAGSRVVVLHVADGWAARTYGPDAVSREILEDTAYLAKVRAERSGNGSGRIYTIRIKVTDLGNNSSFGTVQVFVPHDQSHRRTPPNARGAGSQGNRKGPAPSLGPG